VRSRGRSWDARTWPELATMALVVASTSFNAITADALVAPMPEMAKEFGSIAHSKLLVQMMMVAPSISIIVASPLADLLGERIDHKRLMLYAISLYVLSGPFGYVAPGSTFLIVSRVDHSAGR